MTYLRRNIFQNLVSLLLLLSFFLPFQASAVVYTNPATSWSPSQTNNGWWPALSPDGRYVAYGNWGESWVTDLQTKQNHDLSRPEELPSGARCLGGQWIKPDTVTFVCELEDNSKYYRYEAKIGEWRPKKKDDDPSLVAGNKFVAADGHWASWTPQRIARDNRILASDSPGGALAIGGNLTAHACDNTNSQICFWTDNALSRRYSAQTPLHQMDARQGYIAYGGYGPVRGITTPNNQDIDLTATPWRREFQPTVFAVGNAIWLATYSENSSTEYIVLRPWGRKDAIILNGGAASMDAVSNGTTITVAYATDRGALTVVTVPANSPRSTLTGEGTVEQPLPPPDGPPQISGFDPASAVSGDTVTIYGENLPDQVTLAGSDGTSVTIAGTAAQGRQVLRIQIDSSTPSGTYTIKVKTDKGEASSQQTLTISDSSAPVAQPPNPQVPTEGLPTDLGSLIETIFQWSISLVGIAVFASFFYAGLEWFFARGNSVTIGKAKTRMNNALLGALLLFSAYIILYTINPDLVEGRFTLPGIGGTTQGVPSGPQPQAATCNNEQSLARMYTVPYPAKNAPELDELISCIRGRLPNEDLGSIFTIDQSRPLCNYTRGQNICGACSHSTNSCHYGGRNGSQGALAVDFGNEVIGERIISVAASCGAKSARCENASGQQVACSAASHVHVNSRSCDSN